MMTLDPIGSRITALLRAIVAADGVPGALAYLNRGTDLRCTALVRGVGGIRRYAAVHDRCASGGQPSLPFAYLDLIERGRCPVLATGRAGLPGSPSFCGVPLLGRSGAVEGALFHLDPEAGRSRREHVLPLRALAAILQEPAHARASASAEHPDRRRAAGSRGRPRGAAAALASAGCG